jgi:PAS domain S-box-containing protein
MGRRLPLGKAVTVLLAACCFMILPSRPVQAQPVKNILVLHEGWEKWPSNALVNSQLQAVFGGDGSFEVHFFQEYVDEWRLGRSLPDVAEALHRKYAKQKLDVIVAVGFVPFNLLLSQSTKDFHGVPVVFVSVGDFELPSALPKNITGVVGHLDLARTIELGLRLQPDKRHLFLVSGSSDYERFVVRALQPQLRAFAERLEITDLSDLPLEQLLTRVSQLPDHSIVFFLTMLKDAGGQSHIPSHVCSLLSASANAPLYAFVQGDIDSGIVGGSMYSVEKNAREAAEMALQVLKGARVQDLPIRPGPRDEIIVDWRQLQRWHIPQSRVPKDAAVLFREPGTWESYRWYIVATITMVLLQFLLIAALIVQGRRRAAAEKAVQRRLEMETLISETSARFINLPAKQIGAEIEGGLDRARSFLNVEGIFLYGRAHESTDFHVLHLTRPEQIGLMFPVLSRAQFPWAVDQLKGGHAWLVESMDQLPPEAVAEWAVVAQWGIKSLAAIPLQAGGEVLGLLIVAATTQQRGWPQEVVQQLQILGDIFYQAVLRARAEEAALESEERFALVADCAPMLVWMSGPDKLSSYFNKGWLDFTGRALEQELGDGWIASVHPEDLARLQSTYSQAFDNRKEFKLECRLRRQDGQYRWIMDPQ